MSVDPSVITMLVANDVIKLVFKEVLKNRRIQFKDLRESLTKAPEMRASLMKEPEPQINLGAQDAKSAVERGVGDAAQRQIENAVYQLKQAKLVEERPARIKDFSTIYITEDGLNAERDLRQTATV